MQGYNFTDRVRQTLQRAREAAGQFGHEYVSPDHILLGLVSAADGVAAAAVTGLGGDLNAIGTQVAARLRPGTSQGASPDLPYTSRAKAVLEQAMTEARELGHRYVGTEHLLLGLLREAHSIAAEVLEQNGLGLERLRAEVVRLLGTSAPPQEDQGPAGHVTWATAAAPQLVDPTARRVAFVALAVAVLALLFALR